MTKTDTCVLWRSEQVTVLPQRRCKGPCEPPACHLFNEQRSHAGNVLTYLPPPDRWLFQANKPPARPKSAPPLAPSPCLASAPSAGWWSPYQSGPRPVTSPLSPSTPETRSSTVDSRQSHRRPQLHRHRSPARCPHQHRKSSFGRSRYCWFPPDPDNQHGTAKSM